ncbi:hypothetical protein M422DRAFT_208457 [Sphaerobolus stellatus SS14]|uniref:37S ribosomal protein mrp10, mitochondrial n=1 Tax=Sphaerobolus stellatus (strain SS14) TaxID=990650 RepID=A0A0C9VPQ1_SPHS4|nr:hypothetical protein M422DRAFT_208457 [Sphaerobolus stellatus SS14]
MSSIPKLKVKPAKLTTPTPCSTELIAMLGCWSATGDALSVEPTKCADVAKALHDCMKTAPRHHRQHRPSINYHLARLNKLIKR